MVKDNKLREWMPHRTEYLNELFFLEGYQGFDKEWCLTCNVGKPLYRCRDCFIGQPVCISCCLSAHLQHPLHVIKVSCPIFSVLIYTNLTMLEMVWRILFSHITQRNEPPSSAGPSHWHCMYQPLSQPQTILCSPL